MPATVEDATALLRAAVQAPYPVVYVENRRLYGLKEPRPETFPEPGQIGRAAVRRPGQDVTVVTWSRMVGECLDAADRLEEEGISAEVIDLRTIVPYDAEAILTSVAKTGSLIVVHEAVERFGPGGEIVAHVCAEGFSSLRKAPMRIGGLPSPIPFSPSLEKEWLPDVDKIVTGVQKMLGEP